MNKEQAEIYVTKSLNTMKTTSKSQQCKFLLLNIVCFVISALLYRSSLFIIVIALCIILNVILVAVLAKKKSNFNKMTILIGLQLVIFCIALNCIILGIYKISKKFILWEFILSIFIQILAWIMSLFLVKMHAKQFRPSEKVSKTELICGSIAGFSCALTLVLCRIFSPSLSAIITPLALLLNILICLIGVGIMAAIYRVYLIKKYNLQIQLDK